jgi:hypothetical protein
MVFLAPSRHTDVALIGDGIFSVLSETETLGFVHQVGQVYVSLVGSDLHHAVEVGQSLSWDRALEYVVSR